MSVFSKLRRIQGGGVEDFFTEIFAHLLSAYPDLCLAWLEQSGVLPRGANYEHINITTQQSFGALEGHQHSSRPDVVIELSEGFLEETVGDQLLDEARVPQTDIVFIESKIGSGEGADQLKRYAEQLSAIPEARFRTLVYMTRDYDPKDEAEIMGDLGDSGVPIEFVQIRWHEFYSRTYARTI